MDKSSIHGPRRIQLFSSVPLENTKKPEKLASSTRLTIKLAESTDLCCPEYSYVELLGKLKDSKESSNDNANISALDPFAREDEKEMERLEKIAQSFNEKYGSSKKVKRKRNIRDLVDLGEGYMEDSFVDNSEAYDEVVPWSLDTKYGGFYINTGTLDFVRGDDDDEDYGVEDEYDEEEIMPVRKKKKVLVSSDNDEPSDKNTPISEDGKMKKKKRKKAEKFKTLTETQQTKNSCMNGKLSAAVSQEEFNEDADGGYIERPPVDQSSSSAKQEKSIRIESNEGGNLLKFINDLIQEINTEVAKLKTAKALASPAATLTACPLTTDDVNKAAPPIPSVSIILTTPLLEMISRLYSLCQTRSYDERSKIFLTLSQDIGISKEGLFKKIKRYRININNDKLNEAKTVLSNAVSNVMPALMNKYKELLNENQKLRLEQKEMMMRDDHHTSGADDDDADDDNDNMSFNKSDSDKLKKIIAPRKKFPWTSELRKMLCDVVELRLVHYDMSRIKSQSADDHIKQFLEADVRCLWPPGWMQMRVLYKESRAAHQKWTGDTSKMKKTMNLSSTSTPPAALAKQQEPSHPQTTETTTTLNKNEPIVINLDESDDNGAMETPSIVPSSSSSLSSSSAPQLNTTTTITTTTIPLSKEQSSFTSNKIDQQQLPKQQQPSHQQHHQQQQHIDQHTQPRQSQIVQQQQMDQDIQPKQPQVYQLHQQQQKQQLIRQSSPQQSPQQSHQPQKSVAQTPQKETFTNLKDKFKSSVEGGKSSNFMMESLQNSTSTTSTQQTSTLYNNIHNSADFAKSSTAYQKKNAEIVEVKQHHEGPMSKSNMDVVSDASKMVSGKQMETCKGQATMQNTVDHAVQPHSDSTSPSSSRWVQSQVQQAKYLQQQSQQQKQFQQKQQTFQHEVKSLPSRQQNVQQPCRKSVDVGGDKVQQQQPTNYKSNPSWNVGTFQQQNELAGFSPQQQMIFQQKYQQYQQQQQEKQQQIMNKSPKQEKIANKSSPMTTSTPRRVATTAVDNYPDDLMKTIQQHQQQFLSQSAQQRQQQQHVKQHQQTIDNLEAVDKLMQQQGKQQQQQQQLAKQHSKSHSVEIQLVADNMATQMSRNQIYHKTNIPTIDSASNKPNYNLTNIGAASSLSAQTPSTINNNNNLTNQQRPHFQQQQTYGQHQNTPYVPHQSK